MLLDRGMKISGHDTVLGALKAPKREAEISGANSNSH